MGSFFEYLREGTGQGIQHLEHAADHAFDPHLGQHKAIEAVRSAAQGHGKLTRKIDGSPSFQVKRHRDGRIGVKYKGSGSHYNYSHEDVEHQHGHKPYLAHPIHAILHHIHKVLPDHPGEYQGDYMSSEGHNRHHTADTVSHKPNTIKYTASRHTEEGKHLAGSKLSVALFAKIHKDGSTSPITSSRGFKTHHHVHMMKHIVSASERRLHPDIKHEVDKHLAAAHEHIQKNTSHLEGHSHHLRSYVHSTVSSGESPSTQGYRNFLHRKHNKAIDAVKTEKSKAPKIAQRDHDLAHIDKHAKAFDRTFRLHHHLQQAANHIARGLNASPHGMHADIGHEGYVHYDEHSHPTKIVDREGFTRHNRARSDEIRGRTRP